VQSAFIKEFPKSPKLLSELVFLFKITLDEIKQDKKPHLYLPVDCIHVSCLIADFLLKLMAITIHKSRLHKARPRYILSFSYLLDFCVPSYLVSLTLVTVEHRLLCSFTSLPKAAKD